MRALIVYAHPNPASFTAGVRDTVVARLQAAGAEIRLRDLYAEGFQPVLRATELATYADAPSNQTPVQDHCDDLAWADTLIFIYPTWWYGLPAILKGWLDRVFLPGTAFLMPATPTGPVRPGLRHIKRLAVFTTYGASWWLIRLIGAPGKRTLLRGVRLLCAKSCKTCFLAHYGMDGSTNRSRTAHLDRVARRIDRFLR